MAQDTLLDVLERAVAPAVVQYLLGAREKALNTVNGAGTNIISQNMCKSVSALRFNNINSSDCQAIVSTFSIHSALVHCKTY